MILPPILTQHLEAIFALCEKYKVDQLYAFGSVLTDRFDPQKSDLDFWVTIQPLPPLEKGQNLIDLWDGLEEVFEKKVDLISEQEITNPFLKRDIESTRKLIYDRKGQEISL